MEVFPETHFCIFEHPQTFHWVMQVDSKNFGSISSAVLTFIGYKRTDKKCIYRYAKHDKILMLVILYLCSGGWGHKQPYVLEQEGVPAQDDGQLLLEAGPRLLEVWEFSVSCCSGN